MTNFASYPCNICGATVRIDFRALHLADHQKQIDDATAIAALQTGGGGARPSFHQATPAATWTWVHNLGGYPPIALFADDDPDEQCFTDITYTDANTVLIEWPAPTSGWAYV